MSIGAGTLEQRVAALEQAIAGLQGSEALSPTYLTINPANGQIGANFTGLIQALGLYLPDGAIGGAPLSTINWTEDGTPATPSLAAITGYGGNTDPNLFIQTTNATASEEAAIWLRAASGITILAQPEELTLLNTSGQSNFVQIPNPAQLAVDAGRAQVTFTSSSDSSTTTVSHAIGRNPVAILVTTLGAPSFGSIPSWNVFNTTSSNFQVNAVTPGTVNTTTVGFEWFAIG